MELINNSKWLTDFIYETLKKKFTSMEDDGAIPINTDLGGYFVLDTIGDMAFEV